MELPQIKICDTHKKELSNLFKVTPQAIRQILKYRSNSVKAQAVRKKAKSILEKEAKKVVTKMSAN